MSHKVGQPENMVQVPLRRSPKPARGRRLESFLVFLISGLIFFYVGYNVVTQWGVVSFESLDRLARTMMVWYSDPPKLASIGFIFPPLTTFALLPFAAVKFLGSSLIALPLCSAIFGGLMMTVVNRILERCEMPWFGRYVVLILLIITPMIAFHATTGSGHIVSVWFLALALSCMVSWFSTVDTRYLIGAGMSFAFASMADYTLIIWLVFAAIMIAAVLVRHNASSDEVTGSLVAFLTPTFYMVAVWTIFNALIVGKPFAWITDQSTAGSINAAGMGTVKTTAGDLGMDLLNFVWAACPLAFVVVPLLLVLALLQKNELAGWLAGFTLIAILIPGVEALIRNDASEVQYANGLTLTLAVVVGAAWIYRSLESMRLFVLIGLVAGLFVNASISWKEMPKYPYQNMEHAFKRSIETRKDQEGSVSRGGLRVGTLSERAMADYINANIKQNNAILTDNSQTYGIIALSGKPSLFYSRANGGDGEWLKRLRRPTPRIKYFLVAHNDPADLVRKQYPKLGTSDTGFQVVYSTPRYKLVRVNDSLRRTPVNRSNNQSNVQTTPTIQTDTK